MTGGPQDGGPCERIGELYDRFAARLYRYALMVLADRAAAADAVHQVFLGMLRQAGEIGSDERYLRRAIRNECFSMLRRRRREPYGGDALLLEAACASDQPVKNAWRSSRH